MAYKCLYCGPTYHGLLGHHILITCNHFGNYMYSSITLEYMVCPIHV